jgi:hypothetical protein
MANRRDGWQIFIQNREAVIKALKRGGGGLLIQMEIQHPRVAETNGGDCEVSLCYLHLIDRRGLSFITSFPFSKQPSVAFPPRCSPLPTLPGIAPRQRN